MSPASARSASESFSFPPPAATPEQAEEVCAAIRATVSDMFGAEVAENLRVLYGGSMNEGNAALLLAEPDIDGGLIGGAALKADSFIQIVKEAC